MNERIRELMIRAIANVDSINDPETKRMYIPNCFAEKFAELIIKECADTVLGFRNQFGDSAYNEIREYFGVKE